MYIFYREEYMSEDKTINRLNNCYTILILGLKLRFGAPFLPKYIFFLAAYKNFDQWI
jgi:hypothetical protein